MPCPLSLMRNTFYIQQAEVYNKLVLIAQIKNGNSCCQAIESAGLLCNIFYKYSDAIVTTLVTKDRVTGHNPAAALYTANSYYHDKLYGTEEQEEKNGI